MSCVPTAINTSMVEAQGGARAHPLVSANVNFVNEKLILRSQWHKKVLQFGGRGERRVMQAVNYGVN